jgi:hypothetical protein
MYATVEKQHDDYVRSCPFPAVRYALRIPAQKIENGRSIPVG